MSPKVVYEDTSNSEVSTLTPMTGRDLINIILVGVGVGLLFGVAYFLLNKFIFGAVLCRVQAPSDCSEAPMYSFVVAAVVAAIAGLVNLARMHVYRPLLVVLASTVALWGIHQLVLDAAWYWGLLSVMIIFGLAYGLFSWIARIRSFVVALILVAVAVVVVRLFIV